MAESWPWGSQEAVKKTMQLPLNIRVIDLTDRFQISKTTAADTFFDVLYVRNDFVE